MPRKREPLPLPNFVLEQEEVLFWDTHHPADYFTEPADLIIKLRQSRKKMVSVRNEEELPDDLKQIAGKHGIPYQKLMRELLRDGVTRLKRSTLSRGTTPARRTQGEKAVVQR